MADLEALIGQLSTQRPARPMHPPRRLAFQLAAILGIYALAVSAVLGIRADFIQQLHRGAYSMELILLLFITLSSVAASVCLAYPDEYQLPHIKRIPPALVMVFVLLLDIQSFLPPDLRMVIPAGAALRGMECALCIGAVTVAPAALMFVLLSKGASVHPFTAGAFGALAAAGVGCLTLRMAEANDALAHLVYWHYLPTLAFAALGAVVGRLFLKW